MVEILIVIFIIAVTLASLLELYSFFLKANAQNGKYIQAVALAQEELEAARNIRDGSWSNLSAASIGAAYYPSQSGSPLRWSLVSGQEVINGFTRQIIFSSVYRDVNDNITETGGTLDGGTLKGIATVFWSDRGQNFNVSLVSYLADWRQ